MDNLEKQNFGQDSYQTGSTQPPKKRGGLIAILLVAVILLAGLSSILGLMNIHLFRMLQAEKGIPVSFERNITDETAGAVSGAEQNAPGASALGMTVGNISELDQRYYQLPAGALINQVDAYGCAAKAGLAAGDIILSFNGVQVQTAEELEQILGACAAGDSVKVRFYRYRAEKTMETTVTLEAEG